jgi:TRAP-type C4-dicarboxylate transport system substrate-binding protein
MKEEARKASKWSFDEGKRLNENALKQIEKEGVEVNYNPDVDSFRKAAEKAYATYKNKKAPWYNEELIQKIRALQQ